MSLEQAAKHLAAHGRGPDTQLVHMTKGEVSSLQTLAKAHGGSLTVNPHTGLPEAGFLSSILPTVVGAAAVATMGPAALPWVAGGMGALTYANTGSLSKGLMAGLGAYGGGSLAGNFMGAGAASLGSSAVESATAEAAKQGLTGEAYNQAVQQQVADKMAGLSNWDKLSAGAQGLTSEAGRNTFMQTMGGGSGLMKTGLMAAAPVIADQMVQTKTKAPEIKQDTDMGQRYTYAPNAVKNAQGQTPTPDVPSYGSGMGSNFGREQVYFKPAYTPASDVRAKEIYGYATGGPIEEMSTANAVGANTGYPMADINQGAYATPYQTPVSQNVVAGAQDVAVDPYTGQEQRTVPAAPARFADGGDVEPQGYKYSTGDQKYSGSAPTGNYLGNGQYEQTGNLGNRFASRFGPMLSGAVEYMTGADFVGYDEAGNPVYTGGLMDPNSYKPDANGVYGPGTTQYKMRQFVDSGGATNNFIRGWSPDGQGIAKGGLLDAYAAGGLSHLGDYSDGGRLLKGPGDGVSDSIPATIGNKRPARLADGEFVVPARIVSELGNGSTDAGARKLYAMLDRVQSARKKSIGKDKVAKNSRADKFLPA